MRERARDKGRLVDIIEFSNNVTMLIEGYTYDKFLADKRTYYSVMKNVEVVGEAAFMLTKAFKEAHPATPWNVVQGMRHVLVHDYATIDAKELYIQPLMTCCLYVSKLKHICQKRIGTSGNLFPMSLNERM